MDDELELALLIRCDDVDDFDAEYNDEHEDERSWKGRWQMMMAGELGQ